MHGEDTTVMSNRSAVWAALGAVREAPRISAPAVEPDLPGLYLDRDGDIWSREALGWRLLLQRGIAVDPASLWDWTDGHVRDYAPFTQIAAN
ncbi:hypothetical protein [Nocardia blacklockiae]|uniref:hypothetical protein n=1 Tax=Nocardia blacklockiae TaxID=480036 RepID=UPI0018954197|nr:hypothetical protein [Nocardia blacklockiae]MBF6172745.1 hypothetical protein [Nocardia blacklockiae]